MSYDERTLAGTCPVCGGEADVKEGLSNGKLSSRTLTCRASYCCRLLDYWCDGMVFESHATVRERGFVTEGQDDADGTAAILNAIEAARDEFFDRPPEERAFLEAIRRDPLDRRDLAGVGPTVDGPRSVARLPTGGAREGPGRSRRPTAALTEEAR